MAPRTSWKHVSDEAGKNVLLKKESVNRWLKGVVADNRVKEANVFHRFLLFRKRNGLESDPDVLIAQMNEGGNKTRREHLQALLDWVKGEREGEFKWCTPRTIRGYYRSVREFYARMSSALGSSQ